MKAERPLPDVPNPPGPEATESSIPSEQQNLLAAQVRANKRLRAFAYFGIVILIVGVVAAVVIATVSLVSVRSDLPAQNSGRATTRQILNRIETLVQASNKSGDSITKAFNQAIALLNQTSMDNKQDRLRAEQELIAIFVANGFKIPTGIPAGP